MKDDSIKMAPKDSKAYSGGSLAMYFKNVFNIAICSKTMTKKDILHVDFLEKKRR